VLNIIGKDGKHAPLEGGQGNAQSKRHSMVSKSSVGHAKWFSLDHLGGWEFGKIPNIHPSNKRMNALPTILKFD